MIDVTNVTVSRYTAILLTVKGRNNILTRLLTFLSLFFQPAIAVYNWLRCREVPLGAKLEELTLSPFRLVIWIVFGGENCHLLTWKNFGDD